MSGIGINPLTHAPVLRDQVYEALEELIITRALAPGQRLVEADLARQLNVSRNPVREALSLLHRAGWVDLRARHGAHVHQPTRREVEDFFRVRTVLEMESARLAARNATEESMAALARAYDGGIAALAAEDPERLALANSAFHAKAAQMADNRVLTEMLSLLEKRLRWYFSQVVLVRGPKSWEEHAALMAAFGERDAQAAAEAMAHHCDSTAAMYLSAAENFDSA